MSTEPVNVRDAIAKLKSFREGDQGVLEVIACGTKAVPALRRTLFDREPSGLFQGRCRAIEALAGLHAYDVLIDFLETDRDIVDPVEQLGEDAVINAAARALARIREPRVFAALLRLARRPALTGVIAALGTFEKTEAIPALIDALEDDASRATAESALKKLGASARAALLSAAAAGEGNSESQRRRRRSVLRLLMEIGMSRKAWLRLRPLSRDMDARIAAVACAIGLDRAPAVEWRECADRLIQLLANDDWMLREEIESCLVDHFDKVRMEIENYLRNTPPRDGDVATTGQIETTLRRVLVRAQRNRSISL